MSRSGIRTRWWTRAEYDRAIELGLFREDEPIELLAGRLVVAEPKHRPHALAVALVAEALRTTFGAGWTVQVQDPIALDATSEPEPDVAVIRGDPRDYLLDHPSNPVLVIEVADSSLRLDRSLKARIYARGSVSEYWIVNLVDRVIEVYREPSGRQRGRPSSYGHVQRVGLGETITPLAAPAARIAVVDLLP